MAARQHVEGTVSAVKPEFVALLYVHVRVLVQTMMVKTMRDPVIVSDNDNSLFMLLLFFCYAKQTFKSFGKIDYIIILTI